MLRTVTKLVFVDGHGDAFLGVCEANWTRYGICKCVKIIIA